MMQIRDWPALVAIIVVLALLVAGVTIGVHCAGGSSPGPGVGAVVPGLGTIAEPTSQSGKPGAGTGQKTIIAGSGYWIAPEPVAARDSLPVAVTVVQQGHQVGVTVTVDSTEVIWQTLDLTWPREQFGVYFEEAWVRDSFSPAVGVAWKPVVILGVETGPAVSVDLRGPDWAALSIRGSRRVYSTFEAGLSVGYRFETGEADGLHIGLSAGMAF